MSKVNAGQAPSTLIPKYIGSDFDKVVTVADNIEDVITVVDNIEDVVTVGDNIDYVIGAADALHGAPITMFTGENPPVLNPMPEGMMWYCTTDGRTYVWFVDEDSGQWVESAPQNGMTDEATNIYFHAAESNVNSAYRSATLSSYVAPETEIAVAHNAINTPLLQAQFLREEQLWVDVAVAGAQGLVIVSGYASGNCQIRAEVFAWKAGALGISLGVSPWVTMPSQPTALSMPVTLANIDVLEVTDSYVVKLTTQMVSGSAGIATILVDGNTFSRFGVIFNQTLIGLNDGIRNGVTTSAPTENAVYDTLSGFTGNLAPVPGWADVPSYNHATLGGPDGPMNAQAEALAARTELLKARGDGYTYATLRAYTGSETSLYCVGRANIFDRANGNFVRDDSDTTTADNDGTVLIDVLGRRWKRTFTGPAIPEWYGAKGDGATNDTAAAKAALAAHKAVRFDYTYRIVVNAASGGLVTQQGACIDGIGTLLGENTDASGQVSMLSLSDNSVCEQIVIAPYNTDATWTDNTSLTVKDADPDASFPYNSKLIGLNLGNRCKARGVTVKRLWRGLSAGGVKDLYISGCTTHQIGVWHTQFYNCKGIQYVNNTSMYGGSSGGVAFSSSKQLTITGNYIKVVGTGINPGGSATVGFNVEDVSITGNTIIARDCINLENGAVRYTVTGNKVAVLTNYNLAGTNGVGIANTSESGGAFQGLIGNGTITGNHIDTYDGTYSFGIRVGTGESNSARLEHFTITGNIIRGAAECIKVHNDIGTLKMRHLVITGNDVVSGARGVRVVNFERSIIEGNIVTSGGSTTISNYYGITLVNYDDVECVNNKIGGYGYPFNLASDGTNPSNARLINNSFPNNAQDNTALIGKVFLDANYQTTRYFMSGRVVDSTIVSTRLTLRGEYVRYQPASPVTINLLGYSCFSEGQMITVEFNGNVTLQHAAPYILLKGGVTTIPANGETITFIAYDRDKLKEVARSY